MDINIKEYIRLNFERALHDGHISICYEPVVRALTGKVCSLEALARWDDPIHGKIPPNIFVPVLEEEHKIHLLDHFIMKKAAIDQYHHLQRKFIQPPVILNLSRCDFALMDPCKELAELTEKYHLPHANFQIEITETAFTQHEEVLADAIRRFRSQGHPIILDNFGYGYSSLAALQRYAIDEISLDRVFFHQFHEDTRKILTSIVLMAKNLGIHVAAEGVQTLHQCQFLRNIGCEKVHGAVCQNFLHTNGDIVEQLQEELLIESPVEGQIFKQAGLTNLITDTPVAILLDTGADFSLLAANEAYQKELRAAGLNSQKEANRVIEFLPPIIQDRIRALANQAIRSHKQEEITCIGEGQYFHFHLKTLAGTNGLYLQRAELRHLMAENEVQDNSSHYDHIVRNLLHIYPDIYLMDLERNRIDIIEATVGHYKAGEHLHGIMKSFLAYASYHIHPSDRQRFLHFIRDIGQQKQSSRFQPHTESGLFRVKQANGSYRWQTFEVIFFQQKNHPCRLICLHDFIFENQPEKEQLLRTIMASYGYTSLPENTGENNISDEQLWHSLMHFSHRKLFWKDMQGRFVGASPAFLRFYGLESINDLIGKTDDDIGWHISNAQMDRHEETVLKQGLPIHDGHGHCITHGRQHTISFSKYPIYSGLNIVGLLGEFRDLEEQEKQQALQRRLYLVDEETNFYNYRGMILASVEFADNLRLHGEDYVGAMLIIPEFDRIAKTYGPHIQKRLLLYLRDTIRREMKKNLVAAHTGSGIFVLFQKHMSIGEMRERLKEIEKAMHTMTEIDGYACTLSCHYALEQGTEARTSDEFLKILSERCLGNLPAFGITGHHGDSISFELEKFDHLNRLIYITDPLTYELVYVNPYLLSRFHLPESFQYAGKKCYELIAGSQEPCQNCPRKRLTHDRFSFRKLHLPWTGSDYWCWNTLITWNGDDYIFSDSIDVKHLTNAFSSPENINVLDASIHDIVTLSIQEEDPTRGIMKMLDKIGRSLAAGHVLLMEEEPDGFHLSCSYEWHSKDAALLQTSLRHLPILDVKPLYDAFAQDSILLVEDISHYEQKHPDLLFHVSGLKRFAAGHVVIGDHSVGYISILNPEKEKFPSVAPLLKAAMHVCSILLRNRNNISYLQELSTVDQLTGIGNRRALNDYLKNKIQNGVSYAIIFTDINGLKKTNDTYGHERGDLLIQTVSFVLTEIMGRDKVFRLGGDEFLSITPCENAIGAGNLLQRIEANLKAHRASAALGYVIETAPFGNIDDLIRKADANMYHDKQAKHLTREDLM